jgi:hypothetical protein
VSEAKRSLTTCPKCGAEQWAAADACWLCGLRADGTFGPRPEMVLPVTLASVVFALMAAQPGVAIIVCIFLAPALFRTIRVMRLRKQRGIASTSLEKASMLAGSFFALFVSVTVVAVATVGTFCGMTVGLASAMQRNSEWLVIAIPLVAGAATLAVAGSLLRVVTKWMKARDRRDFGEEKKRWP